MAMNEMGGIDPPEAEVPNQAVQADPTAATAPGVNLTPLPLTPEQITEWWQQISASRDVRKRVEDKWDLLMKEYLPNVTSGAEDLKAGIHFRNVHTKKAKLFFRNPDLILSPEGPMKGQAVDPMTGIPYEKAEIVSIKQAVLNKKLGIKGVHSKRLVSECLFDILAWAGLGCTKIGYNATIKIIQEPVMQPDPAWVPPPPPRSVLGLAPTPQPPQVPVIDPATGQPQTQPVPVTIFEDWYWKRFSPKKLLLPADLTSSRIDQEAAWIGMECFLPANTVRSIFKLPAEFELKTTSAEDDRVYQHDTKQSGVKPKDLVHIIEIWYKASIFDSEQPHPQAIRQLVLIEGNNETALVHRPSPDQTFNELGQLTPDSMIGFPIHLFANRDLADTPWVWADNAFTNSAVKHINTHRKQSIKLRDANIGKFLYDAGAFTPDEVTRLQRGEVGEYIAVQDGRLSNGADKIIAPVVKNEPARDDYRTAATLKQDVEETLGIGGTNAGATADTVRTATEISTSASALAERLDEERDRILEDYLLGVEKFDTLLQRYATDTDYVEWVGQDGAQRLSGWNGQTIGGCRWAYSAKPDSQLKIDTARDRAQTLEFLEKTAPYSPMINIKPILKKLANQFSLDPQEVIMPDILPGMGLPGMPPGPGAPPPGPGGPTTGALPNAPAPGAGTPQMERSKEVGR